MRKKAAKTPSTPTDAETHAELIDAYKKLPPTHQGILRTLAVAYNAINRSNVTDCLRKIKVRGPGNKHLVPKTLDPITIQLAMAGFVVVLDHTIMCVREYAGCVCRMLLEEDGFDEVAEAVRRVLPLRENKDGDLVPKNYDQLVREVRIGLCQGDVVYVRRLLADTDRYFKRVRHRHPYSVIFKNFFHEKWLADRLPEELLADVLTVLLEEATHHLTYVGPAALALAETRFPTTRWKKPAESIGVEMAGQYILEGMPDKAEKILKGREGMDALGFKGLAAFMVGRNKAALSRFEAAYALLKKSTRKKKVFFNRSYGLFFILALIKNDSPDDAKRAKAFSIIAREDKDNPFHKAFKALIMLIDFRAGGEVEIDRLFPLKNFTRENTFSDLISMLCLFWMDKKRADRVKKVLEEIRFNAGEHGYKWIEAEVMELLSRLPKGKKTYRKKAVAFRKKSGMRSVVDLIKPDDKWKRAFNALIRLKKDGSELQVSDTSSRLAWLVDFQERARRWKIQPREQKKNARGVWSKGRPIALKRLFHQRATFDFLTDQDMEICSHIKEEVERSWQGYSNVSYHFDEGAILCLVGHPLLFWEKSPSVGLEIVRGEPELQASERPDGRFEISFSHAMKPGVDIQIIKESPTRLKVIEANKGIRRIARIIGKGVTAPAGAKKELMEVIDSVSSMVAVHTAIEGGAGRAKETTADPTPHFHLTPFGRGLKLDLLSRPFTAAGPFFRPGRGGETVITEIDGDKAWTRRNLEKEKALADGAVSSCPALRALEGATGGDGEWAIDDPEDCLEVLEELRGLGESVILEWPEGERFRIKRRADAGQLFLNVKRGKDWFSVSGELKLDDDLVLSMRELIELVENSPGRFVRLKDGQFLALTREFRKRLDEMRAYSDAYGRSRRYHPLAALSLEDLAGELGGLRGDAHWKKHLKRLQTARTMRPRVPSTFKAELRDYQVDGFKWLARLSHWGVGACLADDMGLGKTIQALAVILKNAPKGPSLVVAPTSVMMNWQTEVERFAPTLSVRLLKNGGRQKILDGLKPLDLLVVSYGLLQQEKTAEMLAGVRFRTIVLDEAQAIKNATTRRSKAAMNLDGAFKLITTGTPIENHLGELWNLFRFINPGLLGPLKHFNETFVAPIEKNGDKSARRRLRKLIRPFILRRAKNQVLDELPERTDILYHVELGPGEIAFYEALRHKAVETLAKAKGAPRARSLKILAEIMKLRRACCNTRLITPDAGVPSAKLAVFDDLVDELLANRHKALVFSQFVDHLAIIRESVEQKGVSYQYLDGSTSQKERKKRVDAFQAGEGELFLISLKAGGLGLNLTAADYVIHMDPWWNPAVEDQASDRAHRIGQKRPVTVYRLVARDTIEEKIVALHKKKRSLADSLLDGADMSGRMSAAQLLELIKAG